MPIIVNGTELTDLNFNGVDITEAYFNNVKIFEKGGAIGTLEETSWADIAMVSALGTASNYWAVGDTKTFDLSSGETIKVAIAGFAHDDKTDGSGKAGITFTMNHTLSVTNLRMHSSATNVNIGWDKCEMRLTKMPQYLALFPQDLQNVIKEVYKPTSAGWTPTIINSTDKLWLFSEVEIDNATGQSNLNEGTVYPYFSIAANRKKVQGYNGTKTVNWWTRSPSKLNRANYVYINANGAAANGSATNQASTVLGFCI